MEVREVKKILRYHEKAIVNLALEMVNLNHKEMQVINLTDLQGYTDEETAEMLNLNSRTVSRYKAKARDKMAKTWDNKELIKAILEED